MAKRKKITAAARRRVEAALERHGLLTVRGQSEVPSLADLLANHPVTTRGYHHDYVPAWTVRWELEQRPDLVLIKLFRGRSTLVARRLWPAVDAIARASREGVIAGFGADDRRAMLTRVEEEPGSEGDRIKRALGWGDKAGSRRFQRVKNDLAQWLCVVGEDQPEEDDESHTHDLAWLPWREGALARGLRRRKTRPPLDRAVSQLMAAIYPRGVPDGAPPPARLLPALKPARSVSEM